MKTFSLNVNVAGFAGGHDVAFNQKIGGIRNEQLLHSFIVLIVGNAMEYDAPTILLSIGTLHTEEESGVST
jgi:hypothetical protein